MTTAQLISELEKRGVLPIEEGDRVTLKKYNYKFVVREVKDGKADSGRGWSDVESLTHLADDPRLLGRVLRELEKDITHYECSYNEMEGQKNWMLSYIFNFGINIGKAKGDTLLEAALKALLKKVEGEQS